MCFYIGPNSSRVLLSFIQVAAIHTTVCSVLDQDSYLTFQRPTKIGIVIRTIYLDENMTIEMTCQD
jgi:hypothetical protein